MDSRADEREQAERFADLFRAIRLTYHRRDGPRSELTGASRAVLTHLAVTRPLTVGEAATHPPLTRVRRSPRDGRDCGSINEGAHLVAITGRPCESCGMPIETGRYCAHCVGPDGELPEFDERFARMVGWQARRHPEQSTEELDAATLEYMATMPAWRDHPRVAGRA